MNTKNKLKAILNSVTSHHDFESAIASIRELRAEDHELFELLWPRAIKAQTIGGHVLVSALTLYKLNIHCPLPPQMAVEQLCREWDVSIEEVPWYLANQFSKEVILDLSEKMEFKLDAQTKRLKTINYWIRKMI